MKYIDNAELREWVKDSLKMTIFQKAHALAVQTGCQILVKLQDDADVNQQQQYYATSRLKKVYRQNGLREQPGEKCVSGVTGLPLVEQGIQSEQVHEQTETSSVHSDQAQRSTPENGVKSQESGPDERLDSSNLTAGPVPMQLSLSSDSFPLEDSEEGSGQTDMKPDKGSLDTIDNVADPVRIKVERVDDDDPGGGGGNNTRDTDGYEEQMNFDTSIQTPMSAVTPHKATQQLLQASSLFQQEQQSISTTIPPSPATIVQHQQQVPMSPKPYQCAMCGKAFRSVQVLQKHTQTFHMRAQHNVVAVGARNRGNRGRGRQTWQRLTQQTTNPSQTHSFQCVMCNITFPEAEILQEHMTRTHMGGVTPVPQESPANPDFTTQGDPTVAFPGDPVLFGPGTSHQTTSSFPIPHTQSSPNDAPIGLQGTPYTQPSSSAPYSRSVPSTSKAAASDSASFPRGHARPKFSSPCYKGTSLHHIMAAILLTTGPISTFVSFVNAGPKHLRKIGKEAFDQAARELHNASLGQFKTIVVPTAGQREVFIKKSPDEKCRILLEESTLCSMQDYTSRFHLHLPRRITQSYREKLVDMGYLTQEQIEKPMSSKSSNE